MSSSFYRRHFSSNFFVNFCHILALLFLLLSFAGLTNSGELHDETKQLPKKSSKEISHHDKQESLPQVYFYGRGVRRENPVLEGAANKRSGFPPSSHQQRHSGASIERSTSVDSTERYDRPRGDFHRGGGQRPSRPRDRRYSSSSATSYESRERQRVPPPHLRPPLKERPHSHASESHSRELSGGNGSPSRSSPPPFSRTPTRHENDNNERGEKRREFESSGEAFRRPPQNRPPPPPLSNGRPTKASGENTGQNGHFPNHRPSEREGDKFIAGEERPPSPQRTQGPHHLFWSNITTNTVPQKQSQLVNKEEQHVFSNRFDTRPEPLRTPAAGKHFEEPQERGNFFPSRQNTPVNNYTLVLPTKTLFPPSSSKTPFQQQSQQSSIISAHGPRPDGSRPIDEATRINAPCSAFGNGVPCTNTDRIENNHNNNGIGRPPLPSSNRRGSHSQEELGQQHRGELYREQSPPQPINRPKASEERESVSGVNLENCEKRSADPSDSGPSSQKPQSATKPNGQKPRAPNLASLFPPHVVELFQFPSNGIPSSQQQQEQSKTTVDSVVPTESGGNNQREKKNA